MIRPIYFLALLAIAVLPLGSARADLILGTIGFNVDGNITPITGSLNQAFELTEIVTNNTADGGWTAFTGGVLVTNTMSFSAFDSLGSSFSFTDPNFGTLIGQVAIDTGEAGVGVSSFRAIVVTGLFTPGAALNAQGFTETVSGQLQVILQNIGGGGRSASVVLGTTAVPEPTSCVLAGLSLLGLASVRMARSRNARRNSH